MKNPRSDRILSAPDHPTRRWGRWHAAGAGAIVVLLAGLVVRVAWPLMLSERQVAREADAVQQAIASHHYARALDEAPALDAALLTLRGRLAPVGPLQGLPVVGPYVQAVSNDDAAALDLVRGVLPLRSELLGVIRHSGAGGLGQLLALLARPLKASARDLRDAASLAAIRPPAWPHSLSVLYQERGRIRQAATALTSLARAQTPLRAALGIPRPARYLVMFQDGGELRATGGFYSAWAVMTVRNGRLSPIQVGGITSASRNARYSVAAPFPIRWAFHYQKVSMMDSNFSANAPTSLRRLEHYAATIPGMPKINGVILVDTWMLERLLYALGPVTVPVGPGYTVTVSDANTEYALVYVAEKLHVAGARKQFLTPLADTLLARAKKARQGSLGPASAATWQRVVQAVAAGLREEHLVVYANSPRVEALIRRVGWAGALPAPAHENFLEVVDANYGGLKDNAYMSSSAHVAIGATVGRRVLETVTLKLTLHAAANGWMVGGYHGFITAYFPPGTKVLGISGTPTKPLTDVAARGDPLSTMVGATIQFPAAHGGAPGQGTVQMRVLLPPGLLAFPLVMGKQPGLPLLNLTVSAGGAILAASQTSSLRIVRTGAVLRAVPLFSIHTPL